MTPGCICTIYLKCILNVCQNDKNNLKKMFAHTSSHPIFSYKSFRELTFFRNNIRNPISVKSAWCVLRCNYFSSDSRSKTHGTGHGSPLAHNDLTDSSPTGTRIRPDQVRRQQGPIGSRRSKADCPIGTIVFPPIYMYSRFAHNLGQLRSIASLQTGRHSSADQT